MIRIGLDPRFKLSSIGGIGIGSDPRFKFSSIGGLRIGEAWPLNAEPLKVEGVCFPLFLGSPDLTDN